MSAIRVVAVVLLLGLPSALGAQDAPDRTPLSGIADLHNHQFSNLGFGGKLFVGSPYSALGIEEALALCGDANLLCLPRHLVPACMKDCTDVTCQTVCDLASNAEPVCRGLQNTCDAFCELPFVCGPFPSAAGCRKCRSRCEQVFKTCYDELTSACQQCKEPCQSLCEENACSDGTHGPVGTFDVVGAALGEKPGRLGVGHPVTGYPDFRGWPRYTSFTHQQMYYRWLERAFRGGLRLMVLHTVSNEVLCKFFGKLEGFDCSDMSAVDRQIEAAKDLERAIDLENDGRLNGNGWYRIAYSASDARRIIQEGALAVVLGMEVDTAFGCYVDGPCTEETVRSDVRRYYDMGVRHLFPLHVFDNAFGGTGAFLDFTNIGNLVVYDRLLDVYDCSPQGYGFRFGKVTNALAVLLDAIQGPDAAVRWSDFPRFKAHCNLRGLTPLGSVLIDEMMNLGMIIDLDHMSLYTKEAVLGIAEARGYPGVVAGHTSFTELHRNAPDRTRADENTMTPEQLDRILALGGMVAPIHVQGDTRTMLAHRRPDGKEAVPFDCGNSSKAFAQAYLYAVDRSGGAAKAAVGMGSDWNGFAGQPAPRFGPDACAGDLRAPQTNPVEYPFALHDSIGGTMDKYREGSRTFDVNTDGLAHAGMLPDFIADLRRIGLSDRDLDPLFRSAEAYVSLWERIDKTSPR